MATTTCLLRPWTATDRRLFQRSRKRKKTPAVRSCPGDGKTCTSCNLESWNKESSSTLKIRNKGKSMKQKHVELKSNNSLESNWRWLNHLVDVAGIGILCGPKLIQGILPWSMSGHKRRTLETCTAAFTTGHWPANAGIVESLRLVNRTSWPSICSKWNQNSGKSITSDSDHWSWPFQQGSQRFRWFPESVPGSKESLLSFMKSNSWPAWFIYKNAQYYSTLQEFNLNMDSPPFVDHLAGLSEEGDDDDDDVPKRLNFIIVTKNVI